MMDLETIVAGGNTPRHTEMALLDEHQKESMSGHETPCRGGAAASESWTIGKRTRPSVEKWLLSEVDASLRNET
jgi:hypothetical protein